MEEKDVSLKNTKGEILEAYQEVLNLLKEKEKDSLKPEKIKEEKKKEEVVAKAGEMTADRVIQGIQQLRNQFNGVLTELAEKLKEESEKYQKLQEAIAIKNQEIKEIFDIEKEAQTLAALIEIQREKRAKLEIEMNERKQELEAEISGLREQWQNEKAQYQLTQKETEQADKKRRDREVEEFQYIFKRQREQAQHQLTDDLAKQNKAFLLEKEKMEKELALREENINEREIQVAEREKKVKELEQLAATFDNRLKSAVDAAVKETTARLKADYESREALLKKQNEGEHNVMTTKVETLSKLIEQQKTQIDQLSGQLEKSYKKVEEIAIKALDSSTPNKLLASFEQLLKENSRSRVQD